jgi:hypothetical protein
MGWEHPRSWTHMFGTSARVAGMAGTWQGLSCPTCCSLTQTTFGDMYIPKG